MRMLSPTLAQFKRAARAMGTQAGRLAGALMTNSQPVHYGAARVSVRTDLLPVTPLEKVI